MNVKGNFLTKNPAYKEKLKRLFPNLEELDGQSMKGFSIDGVAMNEISVLLVPVIRKLVRIRTEPGLLNLSQMFPFEFNNLEEEI